MAVHGLFQCGDQTLVAVFNITNYAKLLMVNFNVHSSLDNVDGVRCDQVVGCSLVTIRSSGDSTGRRQRLGSRLGNGTIGKRANVCFRRLAGGTNSSSTARSVSLVIPGGRGGFGRCFTIGGQRAGGSLGLPRSNIVVSRGLTQLLGIGGNDSVGLGSTDKG